MLEKSSIFLQSSEIQATFVKKENRSLRHLQFQKKKKNQRLKQFTIQKAVLLQSSEIQDFLVKANNVRLVANNPFNSIIRWMSPVPKEPELLLQFPKIQSEYVIQRHGDYYHLSNQIASFFFNL